MVASCRAWLGVWPIVWIKRWTLAAMVAIIVFSFVAPLPANGATGRFYAQTGFTIDDASFLDYFDHRGGVKAFGYPVSRTFRFLGFPVQVFQRAVMQRYPDGHVQLMNLLDGTLFPYTQVNGATFPAVDTKLTATAPTVGSPGYSQAILAWIGKNTPDRWGGLPVAFYSNFMSTVTVSDVFPTGKPNQNVSGFDLEIWGVPTSQPATDPHNSKFVYQRFQRGILHFDQNATTTQGILLADYFKGILMGENIPPDLAVQAKSSPYYRQYNPLKPNWVDQPSKVPGTDLTRAFEPVPTIVLDPGHGGQEVGTSHTFADGLILREKDLNLTIASKTASFLRQKGYNVIQTRTTDSWVDAAMTDVDGSGKVDLADDLQARVDMANNAHATLFLSMHFNGIEDPAIRGTTVYYDTAQPFYRRSQYFAGLLDAETLSALKKIGFAGADRGVQTDSQAVGAGSHFYVLGPDAARPIKMPGALAEALFLTNVVDATQLRDSKTVDAIAGAYARAVFDYYGTR
jgi:N-acetylmuramoyl-L-alanine amidase